jgi:S-(hydroxymethyl)glutathione dehydrogenase/alcohol dehydrogenase
MRIDAPVLETVGKPQVMRRVEVLEPGPGEVRVRMAASGVCHSCLHIADGSHRGLPMPVILGDEGAGVVESVGPDVTQVAPGDHVILSWSNHCGRCARCQSGRPRLCTRPVPAGTLADGTTRFRLDGAPVHHMGPSTYAPIVVVSEVMAVPIRRDVSLEAAALIGCAVTTGVGAVTETARLRPGESLAVFGCGGVGINAVQGGRMAGASRIVAVDLSDARLALASRLGATDTVRADLPDVADAVREASGGGVDCAVVATGSIAAMETALTAVAPGGALVLVGVPPFGQTMAVDPLALVPFERRILGSSYGSAVPAVMFPRLVEAYRTGALRLDELITARYRPDQAEEAFEPLRTGSGLRSLIVF